MAAKLRKSWLERRSGVERRVAVGSVDGVAWRAERGPRGGWEVSTSHGEPLDVRFAVQVYRALAEGA